MGVLNAVTMHCDAEAAARHHSAREMVSFRIESEIERAKQWLGRRNADYLQDTVSRLVAYD
jgi:hypothetical protein